MPVPLADALLTATVQLRMVKKLSAFYGVPFSLTQGKWVIASFVSSYTVNAAALWSTQSFIKLVPVVGTALGAVSMPMTAAGFTYALGRVLVRHFENGGHLDDFEPERYKTEETP